MDDKRQQTRRLARESLPIMPRVSTQLIRYVTSAAALEDALAALSNSDFVALDTEFMRESTYFPKLCLVQIATLGHCAVIDPLALDDLEPLWRFLANRERTKVLHAARQDLEVLGVRSPQALPLTPLFDTQIAAALLGHSAQIGYGALVAERLGTTLEKGYTRADWSRRPLSEQQIEYAADDVRYLAPLYVNLRDALASENRLEWAYEEARALESPDLHKIDPATVWRRLKGLDRLRPAQRATAKLLAEWRETLAIKFDKPRGWILADDALREISERMPRDEQDLERLRSVPGGVIRKRGAELLALVAKGEADQESEAGVVPPPRPEAAQLALVTKLMNLVRARGEELRISPEVLATRRDIEQLVLSGKTEHLHEGWRAPVIGERLIALAQGATKSATPAD
jgi:ribonuclease D